MIALTVNGTPREVDAPADRPLLWVLREDLGLVGPKFGCGVAACGACIVHADGQAVRSCSHPVSEFAGRSIVTIEDLGEGLVEDQLHPVQRAWIEEQVPQCGYSSGLPAQGNVVENPSYAFPCYWLEAVVADGVVPVGFWRSVGHSRSAFFDESFMVLGEEFGPRPSVYKTSANINKTPIPLTYFEDSLRHAFRG